MGVELTSASIAHCGRYPAYARASMHHARCFLPREAVAVLDTSPQLVADAVAAFYGRDIVDMRACLQMQYFSPDDRMMARVMLSRCAPRTPHVACNPHLHVYARTRAHVRTFYWYLRNSEAVKQCHHSSCLVIVRYRCMYAQLSQQRFQPGKKFGPRPSPSSPEYKAHDLGAKLAVGLEILAARGVALEARGSSVKLGVAHPSGKAWDVFLASSISWLILHGHRVCDVMRMVKAVMRCACR